MNVYLSLIFFISVALNSNVHVQENSEPPYIKVEGEVTGPLKLYQSDLEKMICKGLNNQRIGVLI